MKSSLAVDQNIQDGGNASTTKKRSAPSSLDAVTTLNEVGVSQLRFGRYEEAELSFSRAMQRVYGVYSFNHIQCTDYNTIDESAAWRNIASSETRTSSSKSPLNYQRDEYDEGMFIYTEAVPVPVTDNSDSCLAALAYNLAQTYVRMDRFEDAILLLELANARLHTGSGGLSNSTVNSAMIHHNIGHCFYRLAKNDHALAHYQIALVKATEMNMAPIHQAAAMNCIAVLHFHQNACQIDQALDLLKEGLFIYRTAFGSDSKVAATVINNIGRIYYLKGEYDQALTTYREALRIRRKLGPAIDRAATVYNTGQTHHQRGELDDAMRLYLEFLEIAKDLFGPNHRDVAIIYKCIAEIHHERNELKQARTLFEQALVVARASLGDLHPELASTYNKLGNLLYEMRELDGAMAYYLEGLKVEQAVLEPNHPHIVITLTNCAQIHKQKGEYKLALDLYRKIYGMQTANNADSVEVASTLSSMGLMEYQLKNYEAAFDLYQDALRVRRDHYGCDDNKDVASTLNSIGLVLFKQNILEIALDCFAQSLRIRQKLFGPDHRDIAILWYNIATIYLETGEEEKALLLYRETLRVERKTLGASHADVVLTLQHLAQVHQQRGELDDALRYYGEALKVETDRDSSSEAVAKILNLMGNIHLQRADVDQMMSCFTDATRIYQTCGRAQDALAIAGYKLYGLTKLHPAGAAMA